MDTAHPVWLLAVVTFGIVIVVAVVMLLKFLRKPRNRHPMDGHHERNIDEIRRDGPG